MHLDQKLGLGPLAYRLRTSMFFSFVISTGFRVQSLDPRGLVMPSLLHLYVNPICDAVGRRFSELGESRASMHNRFAMALLHKGLNTLFQHTLALSPNLS